MTTSPIVNPRASVAAVFNEAAFDMDKVPAGLWHFYGQYGGPDDLKAGILFGCPCGCGDLRSVGFDTVEGERPKWHWDGNEQTPTLTPSILIYQQAERTGERIGEHWHGHLTAGVFQSC